MADRKLETDYLVIRGGAAAMAFVDTLLDETDHRIVIVDQHDIPAGTGTTHTRSSPCISRRPITVSVPANSARA